jgi:cold shock CspA family protein
MKSIFFQMNDCFRTFMGLLQEFIEGTNNSIFALHCYQMATFFSQEPLPCVSQWTDFLIKEKFSVGYIDRKCGGFGFIHKNKQDIFFHSTSCFGISFAFLSENELVLYKTGVGRRGPQATHVMALRDSMNDDVPTPGKLLDTLTWAAVVNDFAEAHIPEFKSSRPQANTQANAKGTKTAKNTENNTERTFEWTTRSETPREINRKERKVSEKIHIQLEQQDWDLLHTMLANTICDVKIINTASAGLQACYCTLEFTGVCEKVEKEQSRFKSQFS